MHQALPPPPSPPWDGSHILAPYEIFPLPPLWCGGGVALSPSPPVVWWGCGMYNDKNDNDNRTKQQQL